MLVAITVTYNSLSSGVLEDFFRCVARQTHKQFKLIVVDNNSLDGTVDFLNNLSDPPVKCIFNKENIGFGAACNQAIEVAKAMGATYILFLNNDTEFDEALFESMEASLVDSGATALTPVIMVHGETSTIWYGGGSFRRLRGFTSFHDAVPLTALESSGVKVVQFAPACCLLFKAEFLYQHGGFFEGYFVYWEDVDYCLQMERAGGVLVVDQALRLCHKVSSTTGLDSDFSIVHKARGHLILMRRFFPAILIPYVLVVRTLKVAVRLMIGRVALPKALLELKWLFKSVRLSAGVEPYATNYGRNDRRD